MLKLSKGNICLRQTLNNNIDDIDLLLRQLAEIITVSKAQRVVVPNEDIKTLMELLRIKEDELNSNLELGKEMTAREELTSKLRTEISQCDKDISKIHSCLKEAEKTLITAIFQADQKLKSIAQANAQKVAPDDVIRYAHRISSSNAVAAPLNWQQGDPERPFPTDIEMRSGWMNQINSRDSRDFQFVPGSFGSVNFNSTTGSGTASTGPSQSMVPAGQVIPSTANNFAAAGAGPTGAGPESQQQMLGSGVKPAGSTEAAGNLQEPSSVKTDHSEAVSETISSDSSSSSSSDSP